MKPENSYKGIKHVCQFVSNSGRTSIPCQTKKCRFNAADQKIDMVINRYIKEHGFEILHIGTETEMRDNDIHYFTVALLGLR